MSVRYNHIFTTASVNTEAAVSLPPVTKKKVVVDDSKKFSRELATLQYGLLSQEREKAKSAESKGEPEVTPAKPKSRVMHVAKLSDMYSMIDDEINMTLRKTSWNRLSPTYKWKFAQEYIDTLELENPKKVLAELKKVITSLPKVVYNKETQQIEKLNVKFGDVEL